MKTHSKFLSVLAAASMVSSVFPAFPAAAKEGTGSSNLSAAAAIKSNVEQTKFTHKEWTGTDYTDASGNTVTGEDVFGIEREAASTQIIPYQTGAAAQQSVWDYNARTNSTLMQMLTGDDQDWELTVVQNQTQAEKMMTADHAFYSSDFTKGEGEDWKTVQLPRSWTT